MFSLFLRLFQTHNETGYDPVPDLVHAQGLGLLGHFAELLFVGGPETKFHTPHIPSHSFPNALGSVDFGLKLTDAKGTLDGCRYGTPSSLHI